MNRVWRGGVAEGPCGGAVKYIHKHMLQFKKIIQSLVKKSSSVKQQRHENWACVCVLLCHFWAQEPAKAKKTVGVRRD